MFDLLAEFSSLVRRAMFFFVFVLVNKVVALVFKVNPNPKRRVFSMRITNSQVVAGTS